MVQISRSQQESAGPMPEPVPRNAEEVQQQPVDIPQPRLETSPSLPPPTAPPAPTTPAPAAPQPQPQAQRDPPDRLESPQLPARLAKRRTAPSLEMLSPSRSLAARPSAAATRPLPPVDEPESMQESVRPLEVFPANPSPIIARTEPALSEPVATDPQQAETPSIDAPSSPQRSAESQEFHVVIEGTRSESDNPAQPPRRPTFLRPGKSTLRPGKSTATVAQAPSTLSRDASDSNPPAMPEALQADAEQSQPHDATSAVDADPAPGLPSLMTLQSPPANAVAAQAIDQKTTLRVRSIKPAAVRPTATVTGVEGCSFEQQIDNGLSLRTDAQLPTSPSESHKNSLKVISVR